MKRLRFLVVCAVLMCAPVFAVAGRTPIYKQWGVWTIIGALFLIYIWLALTGRVDTRAVGIGRSPFNGGGLKDERGTDSDEGS